MKIRATYEAKSTMCIAPIRMFVRPESRFDFNNNRLIAINTIDSGSKPEDHQVVRHQADDQIPPESSSQSSPNQNPGRC